jgi:hypothetical protein
MTDDPAWEGETRRIDADLLRDHLDDELASFTYLVGSTGDDRGNGEDAPRCGGPGGPDPSGTLQRLLSGTSTADKAIPR